MRDNVAQAPDPAALKFVPLNRVHLADDQIIRKRAFAANRIHGGLGLPACAHLCARYTLALRAGVHRKALPDFQPFVGSAEAHGLHIPKAAILRAALALALAPG